MDEAAPQRDNRRHAREPDMTAATIPIWNALGMDSQQRIYVGFTSRRADAREDFVVFRYDPSTGERRFLGTFMDASQAAGNLRPSEEIPKGHTRMLEIDGK